MKKLLSITFLFIYSLAFSGMVITMHFCGGELESWNINEPKNIACCCESAIDSNTILHAKKVVEDKDNCCSNESLTLKINKEYSPSFPKVAFGEMALFILPDPVQFFYNWEQFTPLATITMVYYGHAPPKGLWQNIPLYKLQSKLLVYDIIA